MNNRLLTLLTLSFITFLFGMPLLVTGTYLIGGGLVSFASLGIWYSLRKSQNDAVHQHESELAVKARSDAYTNAVHSQEKAVWSL